jgi:hypothetical protein
MILSGETNGTRGREKFRGRGQGRGRGVRPERFHRNGELFPKENFTERADIPESVRYFSKRV